MVPSGPILAAKFGPRDNYIPSLSESGLRDVTCIAIWSNFFLTNQVMVRLLSSRAVNFVLCKLDTHVQLPNNPALKSLLLDKHTSYNEAFEKDKDDYVNK